MLEHEFVMETLKGMYKNYVFPGVEAYEIFIKNSVCANSIFYPKQLICFVV